MVRPDKLIIQYNKFGKPGWWATAVPAKLRTRSIKLLISFWWDSNQEPDRYEREDIDRALLILQGFSFDFVRVRSGCFWCETGAVAGALPDDRPGLSRRDVGVARFVIYPAMLIPQFLDLDQACFRQSRCRIVRQSKPEQLPAKLGERYAELLIGIRAPAFERGSQALRIGTAVTRPACQGSDRCTSEFVALRHSKIKMQFTPSPFWHYM
jgi:hypothetical protein